MGRRGGRHYCYRGPVHHRNPAEAGQLEKKRIGNFLDPTERPFSPPLTTEQREAGMSHYANQHRREAIKGRQRAAHTIDPEAKRILEDIARSWEVLAEHTEWLEHKLVSLSLRQILDVDARQVT